ncbi:copper/silver efflux system membrane fusion protein CusB [Cedecea neteri]|uniref:Copper/silver efflux system membrane fusion protein CusB n=1 Tax=Cedecea neteri TaxID=158822 RepID=A0A2X2SUK4_9ENTR|nr:copper/silver efflux system membrane fusion protein CusB [Cedecea neteri]
MPAEVIRQVERSGKPQTRVTVRAKLAGYVNKLEAREGQQVTANAPLFEVASLDSVWIVVDYPQSQAQALQPGSQIVATRRQLAWGGVSRAGKRTAAEPRNHHPHAEGAHCAG